MGHKGIAMTCRYSLVGASQRLAAVEQLAAKYPETQSATITAARS